MSLQEQDVLDQPSWVLTSGCVEMAITRRGAHMSPVRFGFDTATPVEPYYISPWQGEHLQLTGLWSEVPLRGDFFCMPFGFDPASSEKHPPHGETSGAMWAFAGLTESSGVQTLTLVLETKARPGSVRRAFSLVEGHNVIYCETTVEGFAGPMTMAHHAVLRAPLPEVEGGLLLSNSGMRFGMVYPDPFGSPARGEYQSLGIGASFSTLDSVPSHFKSTGPQDCSVWPVRRGFTDLLQIAATPQEGPAWTVAVNAAEGYLWFSLKDTRVLPSTIFWIENRGRHSPPWSGRNCALGLEDACTFFDYGAEKSSQPNAFSERGVQTAHVLDGSPFTVRYIQGIARCPGGFGRVVAVKFSSKEAIFMDAAGIRVSTGVQSGFLFDAPLIE